MTSITFEHEECDLNTEYGFGRFHCFAFGSHEEDNILCLEAGDVVEDAIVRVQTACYTGAIFQSKDCDCHEQLHRSLGQIFREGGLFIYMICDGRGAGLLRKVEGLALGDREGIDTHDAYIRMGLEPDPRSYVQVAVAPAFVLPAESDDELDDLIVERGTPRASQGSPTFPLASRELPVPAQQGLGRDEKATPAPPWKKSAEHSKDRSVCGSVANATMELPLEHADLVAQHHQLDVLVQSCPSAR